MTKDDMSILFRVGTGFMIGALMGLLVITMAAVG